MCVWMKIYNFIKSRGGGHGWREERRMGKNLRRTSRRGEKGTSHINVRTDQREKHLIGPFFFSFWSVRRWDLLKCFTDIKLDSTSEA